MAILTIAESASKRRLACGYRHDETLGGNILFTRNWHCATRWHGVRPTVCIRVLWRRVSVINLAGCIHWSVRIAKLGAISQEKEHGYDDLSGVIARRCQHHRSIATSRAQRRNREAWTDAVAKGFGKRAKSWPAPETYSTPKFNSLAALSRRRSICMISSRIVRDVAGNSGSSAGRTFSEAEVPAWCDRLQDSTAGATPD